MSLHVTHVITKLDVGGAQTHVVELAIAQADAGYQVEVVAGLGGPAADRLAEAGVDVHVVPDLGSSHGRYSQRTALREVHAALRRLAPDVVHGHSSNAGLSARLGARRLRLPSVYTAHGWPFQNGAAWKQRAMSLVGEFVGGHVGDAVIVLTEAEYQRAVRARVVPRRRLWIVPNGIADVPISLRRMPTRAASSPTLVMVARFAPPKLQRELLEVLTGVLDVPWTLRLVGDGPGLAECQAFVAASDELAQRVEFLGHRNDVSAVLAAADVGVLWSRYEGLPISVLEYMRAGLCCITSDLPGTRALLGGGSGAIVGSPNELAVAIRSLLTDRSRLDQFAASARRRYESAFAASSMVEATKAVYRAIL